MLIFRVSTVFGRVSTVFSRVSTVFSEIVLYTGVPHISYLYRAGQLNQPRPPYLYILRGVAAT